MTSLALRIAHKTVCRVKQGESVPWCQTMLADGRWGSKLRHQSFKVACNWKNSEIG
jgi:hypothetical protein